MAVWKEGRLNDLEAQLNSAKLDLVLHLTVNMRTTARTTLDSQQLIAKQLMIKMGDMSSDIKSITDSESATKAISAGIGTLTLDYLTCRLQEQDEIKGALLDSLVTNIHVSQGQSNLTAPSTIELSQDTRHKLEQVFIHRLRYDNMRERESTIKEAHQGTFLWALEENKTLPAPASNIRAWLESDEQLYWITGKAGSGKSTLMRYMCQPVSSSHKLGTQEGGKAIEARCEQYLRRWSGNEQKLIVASFYFWAIGERSQASQEGLFRTLLVQLLQAHPDVIPMVSPSRWESLCLFNEYTRPFTEDELGTMFQHAVAEISSRAKVALFIDGLDEFDGDCNVLINLLKKCVSYPIKVCVASRPWNEFSDAFQHDPSLRMEELTRHDMKKYVVATFGENPQFQRLQQRKANFAHDLIEQIVEKASGVFLWVTVVVASLSSGMTDGDRIEDLERVLDHLPTELEKLYETIVGGIKSQYLEHAAQYFRLMSSCTAPPSLLLFWYADEENLMERVLNDESEAASDMEIQGRLEDMRRRLSSRCKGLLEVHDDTTKPAYPVVGGTVRYLHKTVVEFVSSPLGRLKLNQLLETEHDPNFRLAAASVTVAQILERWRRSNGFDDLSLFEPYISSCLYYASRASPESGRETVQLMNIFRLSLDHSVLRRYLSKEGYGHLHQEARFLCMATQKLVLEYTMAEAPRGCLIVHRSTPARKPKSRTDVMRSSIQNLRGIPEGPALSLLSLPPLTGDQSYDMFKYLLGNGAKLNIRFHSILAIGMMRATPWEEILAKAIQAFGDGVAYDERHNVSKCVRLMIDRGAKLQDHTIENAFKLAHQRMYYRVGDPRREDGFAYFDTNSYQGITKNRVYNALKSMKKDSRMTFRL